MEFGISLLARVTDHNLIQMAETLGYDQAWVGDIPMVDSDPYVTLALAAERTSTIQLGTGISVANTRLAPTHAQSIATLAEIAPGRVELGFGTGNSAPLSMGIRPARLGEIKQQTRLIRSLLRGERGRFHYGDTERPVQFLHPDRDYINIDQPIPVALSAIGPKTLRFCGKEADVHMTFNLSPDQLREARDTLAEGAREADRDPEDIPSKAIMPVAVLEEGESASSQRILDWLGPFVTNYLHYYVEYQQRKPSGRSLESPSEPVQEVIDEYLDYARELPEDDYHLTLHRGHASYVREDEERFITPEMVEKVALVGQPDELIEDIKALEEAGLDQFAICCTPDDRNAQSRTIQDFANRVMNPY